MTGTDTRVATEEDVVAGFTTSMSQTEGQRRIRTLINELEEGNRSAIRELESEAVWIRRMQEQTSKHLDVLLQMEATFGAIQSWIGGE